MLNRLFLALIVLLAGLALGVGLGLYVGWRAWPVTYSDTDLASLRADYRDDYVVMVATAYGWDGDLGRARARLAELNPDDPLAVLAATAERLAAQSAPEADRQRVNRLSIDLRAAQPSGRPPAGAGPP